MSELTTGSPEGIALRATGMSKSFGTNHAVSSVDLELHRGRIHALLGENGAGKSTLISMICGQYRPDAGVIEVSGRVRNFRGPRDALDAGIGVVHQDFRLVPPFTVTENVVLGTRHRPDRAADREVEAIAERLGFSITARARVQDLVIGQQQQAEIIKLLYRGMDILILDEPTAVLTPQQADQLFAALRTIADSGKAVVFVSHRLAEVAAVADHVTVLRGGHVVADMPAAGMQARDLARLMVGEEAADLATRLTPRDVGAALLTLTDATTSGSARDSLNSVSLALRSGEVVGIAGVSGNGQRALADAVAGIIPISGGQRTSTARAIAYIPEDRLGTGLVGSMTIAQNLSMRRYRTDPSMSPWWISPRELTTAAVPLIADFRIPAAPTVNAAALSGGGQQRVITAREMSQKPDVVVAAQPTRGLDVVSAASVRQRLIDVRDQGGAVLLISEDLDELIDNADRILVMVEGRFVADVPRGQATRLGLGELMTGAA